ncbi:MAG: hypothetical protein OEQ53_20560, partial [Saprospiraceae bacterium]|nr:hypothetical protein [Saprospiraceae bacterium]
MNHNQSIWRISCCLIILLLLTGCSQRGERQQSQTPPQKEDTLVESRFDDLREEIDSSISESSKVDIVPSLLDITSRLASQGIMYTQEPGRFADCSGIFLRVLDSLKHRYPELEYPDKTVTRRTVDLGKWYHSKPSFRMISNPLEMDSLIMPGSVLFYGRPGRTIAIDPTTSDLDSLHQYVAEQIFHMGIVVEVEYDGQ